MARKIYGVDLGDDVTPLMIRDAIINCFVEAHNSVLEQMRAFIDFESEEKFKETKKTEVKLILINIFHEINGSFDNPTKEDLIKVCDKLAKIAKNHRSDDIIKKNYGDIMQLIERL